MVLVVLCVCVDFVLVVCICLTGVRVSVMFVCQFSVCVVYMFFVIMSDFCMFRWSLCGFFWSQ